MPVPPIAFDFKTSLQIGLISILTYVLWKLYNNTVNYFIDKKYANPETKIHWGKEK